MIYHDHETLTAEQPQPSTSSHFNDEVVELRKKNTFYEAKKKELERRLIIEDKQKKSDINKKVKEILSKSFTQAQIRLFLNPGKKDTLVCGRYLCCNFVANCKGLQILM